MDIIVEITIAMRHLVVGGVLLCFRENRHSGNMSNER